MAWLLDTDVCSYVFKRKPPSFSRRLSSKNPGEVFISTITVFELLTGCEKSPARERHLEGINAFLAPFAKLPFTVEDAYRAGLVRAYLEKRGTPVGPYDILLASQALERNLTLATNNAREFRRVKGLKVEDWSG